MLPNSRRVCPAPGPSSQVPLQAHRHVLQTELHRNAGAPHTRGESRSEFEIAIARFQGKGPREEKEVDPALRDLPGHHPRGRNYRVGTFQQRSPSKQTRRYLLVLLFQLLRTPLARKVAGLPAAIPYADDSDHVVVLRKAA